MELFWKAVSALLFTSVLGLTLAKQEKDLSILLTMAACCMGAVAAANLLQPILETLRQLEVLAQLQDGFLGTLLKCAGISLVTEIAGVICQDSGSASLGKTLQLLGNISVLYVSTPLFTQILSLIREILYSL